MNIYTSEFPSSKAMPYVYRLDHPVTGEFYIGSRWKNYTTLNLPSSSDIGLKYFTSSKKVKPRFHEFNWTIIAEFFDADSAYDFEQLLIFESWKLPGSLNKSCYHGNERFNTTGVPCSDETKLKISNAMKGKTRVPCSDETKLKLSIANKCVAKGPPSEEHKLKLSIANTGKSPSDETKLKISIAQKGKPRVPHSDETKVKMSIAKKGVKHTVVTCPHCNKSGGSNAMKQWHFDNCVI